MRMVLAFLLCAPPALAADNAADLERVCKLYDTDTDTPHAAFEMGYCAGYLTGALAVVGLSLNLSEYICLPEQGISLDQARRIYLKHLEEKPENLNKEDRIVLAAALMDAFPCLAD